MNHFDKLLLRLPLEVLDGFNKAKFDLRTKGDNSGNVMTEISTLLEGWKKPGVNSITIKKTKKEVVVDISSKLLVDDYYKMFTADNIGLIPELLIDYIAIGGGGFINSAEVMSCDVTMNLRVSRPVEEYIRALFCVCNPHYSKSAYDRESIIFTKEKGARERLEFYDKSKEILKKDINRYFLEEVSNPVDLVASFDGVLRVERNFVSFDSIRKAFKVAEPRLLADVVSSTKNPILDTYSNIISGFRLASPLYSESSNRPAEFFKQRGIMGHIVDLDYDQIAIHASLKSMRGNTNRYIKACNLMLEKLKRGFEGVETHDHLKEIERLIRHGK